MKRFLLLFCTVVLVFSIMIVPAFAFDSFSIEVVDTQFVNPDPVLVLHPDRLYDITLVTDDFSYTYHDVYLIPEIYGDDTYGSLYDLAVWFPVDDSRNFDFDFTVLYGGNSISNLVCLEASGVVACGDDEIYDFTIIFSDASIVEPLTPVDAVDSIGAFFHSALSWFTSLISVISSSPLLLIMVIFMPVVGILVASIRKKI